MKAKHNSGSYCRLVWSLMQLKLIIRETEKAGAVKTLKRLRLARSSMAGAIRHAGLYRERSERRR